MVQSSASVVKRPNGRDLNLDIFYPPAKHLGAAVILLHGGGWMFGDRRDMVKYGEELSAQGFTAIAAEYRLLGEAPWPAQIQDVKDVIAWVAAEASNLNISPQKIALQGFSAGGHLALLAAGTVDNNPFQDSVGAGIAAVISFFAPAVLQVPPPGADRHPVAALLGPGATEEKAREASPMTYISAEFPPTFLLSGTRDTLVPHQDTLTLFSALDTLGVPTELHLYHSHTHEFSALPSMLAPVQAEVALFLKRAMIDPGAYAYENETLNPFARPGGPIPPPGAPPAPPRDAA